MGTDSDIREFLRAEGFSEPGAVAAAVDVLIAAGLTHKGKTRISEEKLDRARAALGARLVLTCAARRCVERAALDRGRVRLVAGRPEACEFCSGSPNAQAVNEMVAAARSRGIVRILVLGGSPGTREELLALVAGRLELELIDGTVRRTGARAREDLAWAQLTVIWGSTELAHRVSTLYTHPQARGHKVITAPRRGVAALAETVLQALGQGT